VEDTIQLTSVTVSCRVLPVSIVALMDYSSVTDVPEIVSDMNKVPLLW
jgi:hypothetical protein